MLHSQNWIQNFVQNDITIEVVLIDAIDTYIRTHSNQKLTHIIYLYLMCGWSTFINIISAKKSNITGI